jgi:hypothetical protein
MAQVIKERNQGIVGVFPASGYSPVGMLLFLQIERESTMAGVVVAVSADVRCERKERRRGGRQSLNWRKNSNFQVHDQDAFQFISPCNGSTSTSALCPFGLDQLNLWRRSFAERLTRNITRHKSFLHNARM